MYLEINKRFVDKSWNFESSNTKEYTHCYHNYPAMMIPQVARRLIREYSNNNTRLLFDPYCGTGTSLLEANLAGINAIGTDLNPLARLIAKTKTKLFNIRILKKTVNDIENYFSVFNHHNNLENDLFSQHNLNFKESQFDDFKIPNFKNIEFWFSNDVINKLAYIKHIIDNYLEEAIRDFFLVCFSETVRESSYTRNNEFKLFRIPREKINHYNPDPFDIFRAKMYRNLKGLEKFIKIMTTNAVSNIYEFNTSEKIPDNVFVDSEIDLIVTSPPYGDSRTTVAYGQFSRLSNQWLGIKNANQIDNLLMGGNGSYKSGYIEFDSARKELTELSEVDVKRYNDVQSFLIDYFNSINNISKFVKKGAFICYVLGNRTVKKINIPLDLITVEIFLNLGFEHINTFIRDIPNKRMPKANSPTNEVGVTSSTMNNEYIVIMKKV